MPSQDPLREYVRMYSNIIRRIYDSYPKHPWIAQELIRRLRGIPRARMYSLVNSLYRTGPDINSGILPFLSEGRPKGGPGKKK